MRMSYKIVELQGLRCIAIVSVLCFHVFPNVFVNGFLGVDIFFVISGYIMALILLSSNSLKTSFVSTTLNFYYRRIYRILPLYLLNILVSILIIPLISYSSTVNGILSQVVPVLTFSKNFINLSKELNYFDNALSIEMFTHYWSLCVEMQFYAIVPFLLYLSNWMPLLINLFIFWPLMIAASVGLIFYQLIHFAAAGAMFSFNMLPTRFYEFAAGFIAFYVQEFNIKYFSNGKYKLLIRYYFHHFITINILSLILIGIVFYPIKLIDILSIPVTVILTATIITFIGKSEKSKKELRFSVLAEKNIVFIGNASYSLYIFHWIFIIFLKSKLDETKQNGQIILVLCFLTGSFIHEYIEKPICNARLPWKTFFILVAGLYSSIILVAYKNDVYRSPSAYAIDIYNNKSKLIINSSEWKNFASSITPEISAEVGMYSGIKRCGNYPRSEWPTKVKEAWTFGAELKGSGNLSILIIGNSHAECSIAGIKLAMDGFYSELNFVGISGTTPFEGFQNSGAAWIVFQNAVKHYKPDIIFLIFKYQDDFEDPSTDSDFHLMKVQEMITVLSNNSKVVFISGPHFNVPQFYSIKFTEMIYSNGWIKDFKIKQKDIENRHTVSTKRWKGIKCKNCIFIEMFKAFCKNGLCSPLDETRKIPLLFDPNHFTIFGSHLLSINIKEHFNQMFQYLSAVFNE